MLASQVNYQPQGNSRDEQYQKLLTQTDPNSEFEWVVLQEIYQQGYKLPDAAQELIGDCEGVRSHFGIGFDLRCLNI